MLIKYLKFLKQFLSGKITLNFKSPKYIPIVLFDGESLTHLKYLLTNYEYNILEVRPNRINEIFISVKFISSLQLGGILTENTIDIELLHIFCGIGALLGHVYPIYYGFKGGKGAGTMVGVLAALFPMYLIIGFPIWLMILVFTGYVGLSTITAGIILPISTAFYYEGGLGTPFGIFTIIFSLFIIFTHRSNISRMLGGNENRFEKAMIFRKNTQ